MTTRLLSLAACIALAGSAILGLTACDKQGNPKVTEALNTKITPASVAKMQEGMTRSQVVALFGQPTDPGTVQEFPFFKKQTVTYTEGKESLSVTYKNDEVQSFNSTVGTTKTTTTNDGAVEKTTTTTTKTE